jgi:simple sugar transport system permease protein
MRDTVVRPLLPIVLALITAALILLVIGKNPFAFYANVLNFGLMGTGWQGSIVLLAPLMLIAVGLTVAFRAGFWNLGFDGQFIIPAVLVAGVGPALVEVWPIGLAIVALFALAIASGALWALLPAWLKAQKNTNEIVTTLAMSFIGLGIANLLIRGPFQDSTVLVPQTRVLSQDALLSFIPGTRVHVGVLIAFAVVLVSHFVLTRTSWGVRLDVLGANPRAAKHVGMRIQLATIVVFLISGAAIGLAGVTDMLGVWGYVRTDWNPAYGIAVIPFVLIARLNLLATLPLLAFYAVFATGTTIAAQREGISVDLVIVMVALVLGFMALTEWMFSRSNRGKASVFAQPLTHLRAKPGRIEKAVS